MIPTSRVAVPVLSLALALPLAACGTTEGRATPPVPARTSPRAASGLSAAEIAARGEAAGVHNLKEVAPGLFRGAQPEGEESFRLLASLGVKTMLSVDGARPDVGMAAKYGIRYVHVPMEYAGMTREEQLKVSKVGRELGDGLFVHCHHGKHRGPAALAVAWIARDGASNEAALADMKEAGCDPRYRGLYALAQSFVAPSDAELASLTDADLPPVAPVGTMTEAMVDIDAHHARMKAVEKAGWKTPPNHADVVPSHESRIFAEVFRELQRTEDARGRPEDFRNWLKVSEDAAWEMERALTAGDHDAAKRALGTISKTCTDCHDRYRNNW